MLAARKWQNYVQCSGCGRCKVEGSSKWVGYGPMGPQDINSLGYMKCPRCKSKSNAVPKAAKARKSK